MATHLSQDALLDFLRRSGGSVKNADLLLHFRSFVREHPDQRTNRELFKKLVNSVATVQQVDSVSYVVLRKKFRAHVSGGGEQGSGAGEPRHNPAGRAGRAKKGQQKARDKPQLGEVSAGTAVLPAAGIVAHSTASVERNFTLQQGANAPDVCVRAAVAPSEGHVSGKGKPPAHPQHVESVGPRPRITPVVDTCVQAPVPEPSRGRQACLQSEEGLHRRSPPPHSVSLHPQEAPHRFRYRQSYKSAVSFDDDEDEDEEENLVKPSPAGIAGLRVAPLGNTGRSISASSPCITDPPAPPAGLSSSFSSSEINQDLPKINIQNVKEETLPIGGPERIFESGLGHRAPQARPGQEPRSLPWESSSTRRSLPLEAEFHAPPASQAEVVVPSNKMYLGHGLKPVHVQMSSSHSSIFSLPLDTGLSNRERWRNSSYEDVQSRTGTAAKDQLTP